MSMARSASSRPACDGPANPSRLVAAITPRTDARLLGVMCKCSLRPRSGGHSAQSTIRRPQSHWPFGQRGLTSKRPMSLNRENRLPPRAARRSSLKNYEKRSLRDQASESELFALPSGLSEMSVEQGATIAIVDDDESLRNSLLRLFR